MSEGGGAYDASEVDERPKSSHLSRKDVRVLLVVFIILIVLMLPIYAMLKIQRDQHLCKQNLGQIFKAMGLYAAQNNDRYPPVFSVGANGEPELFNARGQVGGGKHVHSWMTLLQPELNVRANFECPASQREENVDNLPYDPEKEPFVSSYGMYLPWSAYNSSMVSNPDTVVLFGETANNGANDTFDPTPYSHGVDGIVIGWDSSNFKPTSLSEFVSRLAFPDSKGGKFLKTGRTRHAGSSLFITAGGQLLYLKPNQARIQYLDPARTEITGRWATR